MAHLPVQYMIKVKYLHTKANKNKQIQSLALAYSTQV